MEKKKSTYYKESQQRYADKVKKYTVKYTLKELDIIPYIDNALNDSNLTANSWIKQAIKEKLINDGYIQN